MPNGTLRKTAGRAVLALCAIVPAFAQPAPAPAGTVKRALTIEDLYALRTPSGLQLSPDGKTLLFTVGGRDFARGKSNTDLYRMALPDGSPARLTFTDEKGESSPAWSPDGKTIAFVARRGDHQGIWLLPAGGGEARSLVELSSGISDPVWSPDGRHIAFVSEVYPECGADDACNERLADWRTKGPLQAHVTSELLYRHWTGWYDGRVNHVLIVEVATGKVRDLTPGEREAPVFSASGAAGAFSFSPDGKELAFTRNPDPKGQLARSTNSDIWTVPVDPGPDGALRPAKNLTADNKAWDGEPIWSKDGRYIAFRRQLQPGYESDRFRLVVLERATGKTTVLTEAFDNWVTRAWWLPDSKGLVFQADEQGQTPLYRIGLDGSAPRRVVQFQHIDDAVLAADGASAYIVRRSVHQPHEIWRAPFDGRPPVRLTTFNKAIEDEVDLRPAEQAWVEGARGRKTHVFIVKPHGFDPKKKYPVILNIHGGPQMQWTDGFRGDWQVFPAAGYVVVFPNPHGSTGYGQEYTAQISGDWGGAVMEDIAKVTDWVAAQPYVDPQRIGAMGWSWGGYAMNWLQATTTRYKALASMMGIYDLAGFYGGTEELWFPEWDLKGTPETSDQYVRFNPAGRVKNFKTPELVITGELDYRIPYTQGLQVFTALRNQGVPAKLVVLPNAGHWPSWYEMGLYYTAHLEWFHVHLGGDPPPWSSEDFAANKVFDFETGKRRR